jgi:hypothetical protein
LAELGISIRVTRSISWKAEFGDGTGELCTSDFGDEEEDLNEITPDLER